MPKKAKKLSPAKRAKQRLEFERYVIQYIGNARARNIEHLARSGLPRDLLSVYRDYGDGSFPITEVKGKSVGKWRYLSEWMKVHVALWVLDEERCLSFSINLHPAYEHLLTSKVPLPDIRELVRSRVRLELSKLADNVPEFFFVIEGADKSGRNPTKLHIHGAVLGNDPAQDDAIKRALKRACGHYIKGSGTVRSSSKIEPTYGLVHKWANYSQKNIGRKDSRLMQRRLAISRPLSQAASELWDFILTGQ